MNKNMFWCGLSVFILEVLGILAFFLIQLDWSWLNTHLIINIIVFTTLALFNIFAFILMIVGLISQDNNYKGGTR